MGKIIPFFMLDVPCDEAARFYAGVFKDSKVHTASPMSASFTLNGMDFNAFRGGPTFEFGQALSLYIDCKDQAEVDHYSKALVAGGGEQQPCGWVRDKHGCSWQVIPSAFAKMMGDPTHGDVDAMVQAMLKMKKLDVKALEKAYRGK
jgi:predicted 3-demethylubiquinone-9 3-methyltransferase (glyoxalase superfamily)